MKDFAGCDHIIHLAVALGCDGLQLHSGLGGCNYYKKIK